MISKYLSLLGSASFAIVLGTLTKPTDAWQVPSSNYQIPTSNHQNRRSAIQTTLKWLTLPSTVGASFSLIEPASASVSVSTAQGTKGSSFAVYQVIPDASEALSPTIKQVKPQKFCSRLSLCNEKIVKSQQGGAIWLGEHHNSQRDHNLQTELIRSMYDTRKQHYKNANNIPPLSIGLEQIQVQFQPVLDAYVEGSITEETMLKDVEWVKRWSWSFDNYRPIFELAKELNLPLIALNVNSEDLAAVEENGLQGLSREQVKRYIKDPQSFGDFSKPLSYRSYIRYVIEPSYDLHQSIGLLKTTMSGKVLEQEMSFRNFFSGRILWDEAMAGNAYDWNMKNPGGLMVGLVGADHVKFEKGITGRYQSLVKNERDSVSVLLNPTLIDTRPSGSVSNYANAASSFYPDQITLQLRYLKDDVDASSQEARSLSSNTGGVLSLADYIVISNTELEA